MSTDCTHQYTDGRSLCCPLDQSISPVVTPARRINSMADLLIGASVQAPVSTAINTGLDSESTWSGPWATHKVPDLIRYWSSQLTTTAYRSGPSNSGQEGQHSEENSGENYILLDEYFLLMLESEPISSEESTSQENKGGSRTSEAGSIVGCRHTPYAHEPYHCQYFSERSTLSQNHSRTVQKASVARYRWKLTTSLPNISWTDGSENSSNGITPRNNYLQRRLLQFHGIKYTTFPFRGRRRMENKGLSDEDSIGSDEDAAILRAYQRRTSSRVSSAIPPQDPDDAFDGSPESPPPKPGRRRSSLLPDGTPGSAFRDPEDQGGAGTRRVRGLDRFSRSNRSSTIGKHMPDRRHSIASTDVEHLAEIFASLKSRPDKLPDIDEALLVLEEDEDPSATSIHAGELEAPQEQPVGHNTLAEERDKGSLSDRFEVGGFARRRSRFGGGGRRASIDVATLQMPPSESNDPHFTREILHQNIINMACSRESIDEEAEEDESDISVMRSRRLSISSTTAAPLLPPRPTPLRGSSNRKGSLEDGVKAPSRVRQRRSSLACTSMLQGDRRMSRATLLSLSGFQDPKDAETRPELKDPYRLTLHYISDPTQSKKLKSLLRPLTQSVATGLKLFNYVDRSEPLILDYKEPDIMAIPSLAVMVFLQEEKGIERILKTQQYLKEDPPWHMHHRDLGVGGAGGVVAYPTNNQDFYSHAEGMPLWAVRQILGKDRLRFMVFVSHENFGEMMSFYSNVLDRDVAFRKEDFCYFAVFACQKRSLEVQLALKRLPPGFAPTPLDAAILQFKVDDMERLLPLLYGECSAMSEVRWQTTDPDGNRVLLLVQAQTSVKTDMNSDETDENGNQSILGQSALDGDIPTGYV